MKHSKLTGAVAIVLGGLVASHGVYRMAARIPELSAGLSDQQKEQNK